jgi:phosphoglycolate phosphatase-like HAD superfamily hydrolase
LTPRLIIFDCDAVLLNSEPISVAFLRDTITDAGGALTETAVHARSLGHSMASVLAVMRDEFGIVPTGAHLTRLRARLYERFEAELPHRGRGRGGAGGGPAVLRRLVFPTRADPPVAAPDGIAGDL